VHHVGAAAASWVRRSVRTLARGRLLRASAVLLGTDCECPHELRAGSGLGHEARSLAASLALSQTIETKPSEDDRLSCWRPAFQAEWIGKGGAQSNEANHSLLYAPLARPKHNKSDGLELQQHSQPKLVSDRREVPELLTYSLLTPGPFQRDATQAHNNSHLTDTCSQR
jgi:hypothetical protein